MAKAKKTKEKSAAIKFEKPKKIEKPKEDPKLDIELKPEEKPVEEKKPVEIKAKIEIAEEKLVMPCLYRCRVTVTKDGKAYRPGSVIKLSQKQVDHILKGDPEALEPTE